MPAAVIAAPSALRPNVRTSPVSTLKATKPVEHERHTDGDPRRRATVAEQGVGALGPTPDEHDADRGDGRRRARRRR